jgi:hypothetical protein
MAPRRVRALEQVLQIDAVVVAVEPEPEPALVQIA